MSKRGGSQGDDSDSAGAAAPIDATSSDATPIAAASLRAATTAAQADATIDSGTAGGTVGGAVGGTVSSVACDAHPLWVFGYGSLMWRPGFPWEEAVPARITGLHRRFCVYSFHHRGTEARPGLVLGLDKGGICDGVAFRVAAGNARDVLAYLRAREQISGAYRETLCPADLRDGSARAVMALAYVVERAHPQFAPDLPLRTQARIICGAKGGAGVNLEYLFNTVAHLKELGIKERDLERICALAGSHVTAGSGNDKILTARAVALTRAHSRLPAASKPAPKIPNRFRYRHCLHAID